MIRTPLDAVRALRQTARQRAEAQLGAELAGLRAAEEHRARCVARQASHVRGRLAVAASRLEALQPRSGSARPRVGSPICQARSHERREQLLRAEEALLEFGRQRAARQLAASIARVADGQALLIQAECRLEVVERFLARRAEAGRTRQRRREEREADDRVPARAW